MTSRRLLFLLGSGLLLGLAGLPGPGGAVPLAGEADAPTAPSGEDAGRASPTGRDDTPLLRCEWADPATGRRLRAVLAAPALLFVPPRGRATVRARGADGTPRRLRTTEGEHFGESAVLLAPAEPGPHAFALTVERGAGTGAASASPLELVLYVPHRADFPAGGHGTCTVGGEDLGRYPDPSRSGVEKVRTHPEAYAPPAWFVRIDPALAEHRITPTLRLGDLVVPDEETGERHSPWAPVRYDTLAAIERFREALRAAGIEPRALRILSLYRAPRYNRSIGSGRYSRHIYGDAFDFVIDADGDGDMDDLTGDGRVDREEALRLIALIEDLQADGDIPIGGIGAYTFAGGDYSCTMHLDLRGHRARWAFHHRADGRRREFSWTSRRFARQDAAEAAARRARRKEP